MSVLWHEEITTELREDANLALASFSLSVGERNALAKLYGVSLRTCERWFAAEGSQRRNCIPREADGKRLIFMGDSNRNEYIRMRCFLPFLYAVPDGIERDTGLTGPVKFLQYKRPTLSTCIQLAVLVVDGLSDGGPFLRRTWQKMRVEETGGEGPNKWTLFIEYRRPASDAELYEEEPAIPEGEDPGEYHEYDSESAEEFVWEPE